MPHLNEVDEGAWGSSAPAAGPFGGNETLGFWFELDEDGDLAGFRQYTDGHHPDFALFQLFDTGGLLVATMARPAKQVNLTPAAGAGWRNTWCRPRARLAASTPYLVACSSVGFWASFGALASGPVINGHFTVYANGSSPQPANGVYDADTDSGGRYNFINPPNDGTAGNFYAVDVLVKFAS